MKLTKEALTEMVKEAIRESDPQPANLERMIKDFADLNPKMLTGLRVKNLNLTALDVPELDMAVDNMRMIIRLLEGLIEARQGNGW